MNTQQADKLKVKLIYNNYDVTKDFSPYIQSITYMDFLEDQSDEIIVSLIDSDKLFQTTWYPQKGAKLTCTIEQGNQTLNCGTFTIHENNFSFSKNGDFLEIRAIAATPLLALRTVRTDYYEKISLFDIVKKIASRYGLQTALSEKENDIQINRLDQIKESDLNFLKRISKKYGYIFKVTENLISFLKFNDTKNPLFSINKKSITNLNLADVSVKKFKGCQIEYYNPTSKKLSKLNVGDMSGDILKIREKFVSHSEAVEILNTQLKNNAKEITGTVTLSEPIGSFIAGVYFNIEEVGNFSGTYMITKTTHQVSNSGWKISGKIEKC